MQHWKNVLNPDVTKSLWSPKEDAALLQLVEKHGKKWYFFNFFSCFVGMGGCKIVGARLLVSYKYH